MATRYYSQNDRDFMDRVNNELVGDLPSNQDGIINQTIVIYQHAIQETKTTDENFPEDEIKEAGYHVKFIGLRYEIIFARICTMLISVNVEKHCPRMSVSIFFYSQVELRSALWSETKWRQSLTARELTGRAQE